MHFLRYAHHLCAACIVLLVALLYANQSHANKITPNHVYQVTEDVILQLERMHDANLTTPKINTEKLKVPPRLPRHVIQQALNVRQKIQMLKRINGIKQIDLRAPEVKEVTPGDVMKVASVILAELVEFDNAYGLKPFSASAPLPQGKTPTDVYVNLLKAEALIVQLGIPGSVPNDVFNNAISVNSEVTLIQNRLSVQSTFNNPTPARGKKPSDAYGLAYDALTELAAITKTDRLNIPKGVIMPDRLTKNIKPGDVQQVLLYLLAELSSLKVKVGETEALVIPAPTGGQTPSSVYDQLQIAVNNLRDIRSELEGGVQ